MCPIIGDAPMRWVRVPYRKCVSLTVGRALTCRGQAERRRPGRMAGPSPCAPWALDSRELGELRAESVMKPVTDSNLCPRAPAHIPADLVAPGRRAGRPVGRPLLGYLRGVSRYR